MLHTWLAIASALGAVATAPTLVVYPPTPRAIFDTRIAVQIASTAATATTTATQEVALEVQEAPTSPQTRDPGYGRPPFPSSTLRIAASTPTMVQLACRINSASTSGCGWEEKDGFKYKDGALVPTSAAKAPTLVVRGVGVDIPVEVSDDGRRLTFVLPPPTSQAAVHYYLQAKVVGASSFEHNASTLFLFMVDNAAQHLPAAAINAIGITAFGVVANATYVQTAAIQHAFDALVTGRGWPKSSSGNTSGGGSSSSRILYIPPGYYRSNRLQLRGGGDSAAAGDGGSIMLQLAPGVLIQSPSPFDSDFVAPPSTPSARCPEYAFIEVGSLSNINISGTGATIDAHGFPGNAVCIFNASQIEVTSVLIRNSASWNTHIYQSSCVNVRGVKLFSGADGAYTCLVCQHWLYSVFYVSCLYRFFFFFCFPGFVRSHFSFCSYTRTVVMCTLFLLIQPNCFIFPFFLSFFMVQALIRMPPLTSTLTLSLFTLTTTALPSKRYCMVVQHNGSESQMRSCPLRKARSRLAQKANQVSTTFCLKI